ncbi:MAG TPA: helix-turn-helix domain-containing protein [Candidatus Dormibacteraeota bacterium]|jgi:transcriptional regulator with XRE-family HTH domain
MDQEDTLGRRIRRIRKQRGMTLEQIGRGDFTRAWVSQIELGRALPSTRVLRVIAERLGTPVEYLLDGREETIERELGLEKARVLLARGEPHRALLALRPALESLEWPFGTDARLTQAEALVALDRKDKAAKVLEREKKAIAEHGDAHRSQRVAAIEQGKPFRYPGDPIKTHLQLADRAQRVANNRDALEHYRAARVLLEAGGVAPLEPAREGE